MDGGDHIKHPLGQPHALAGFLVDDLIATGGTTEAMIKLVEKLGGEVAGVCVLIELPALKGREKIADYKLFSAVTFEGE